MSSLVRGVYRPANVFCGYRCFGTNPLSIPEMRKKKKQQAKGAPDLSHIAVNNAGLRKLVLGSAKYPERRVTSQIEDSNTKLKLIRFYFRRSPLATAHFDPNEDESGKLALWRQSFRTEYAIVQALDKIEATEALVPKIRLSGACMNANPSGTVAVFGTLDDFLKISSKRSVQNSLIPIPLSSLYCSSLSTWKHISDISAVVNDVSVQFLENESIIDKIDRTRFGEGAYRIQAAIRGLKPTPELLEKCHLLVVGKKKNQGKEQLTLTLPGGKRRIFQTAHKAGESYLHRQTGLSDITINKETPVVSHISDNLNHLIFMHNLSPSELSLEIDPEYLRSYASRFEHL